MTPRARELLELNRLVTELRNSSYVQYQQHLTYVVSHLRRTPVFAAALKLIEDGSKFDSARWLEANLVNGRKAMHSWPASEPDRLRLLLDILLGSVHGDKGHRPGSVGERLIQGHNFADAVRAFSEQILDPILRFIQANIEGNSLTLHTFERLRRQIEWFEREKLYDPMKRPDEQVFDRRTREFLFSEGIDYPISQPRSPSGETDVVANLGGEDPVVCEIKVYGQGYGIDRIASGVRQSVRYAHDYGKSVGHLVVFNVSDERLEFPSDGDGNPPQLTDEGVTVYIIHVQVAPLPSASKDSRRTVRKIGRQELVTEIGHVSREVSDA